MPGKTLLRNYLLCVQRGVKLYLLTHSRVPVVVGLLFIRLHSHGGDSVNVAALNYYAELSYCEASVHMVAAAEENLQG